MHNLPHTIWYRNLANRESDLVYSYFKSNVSVQHYKYILKHFSTESACKSYFVFLLSDTSTELELNQQSVVDKL